MKVRPVGPRLGSGRELAVCFRRGRCWHHPGTLRRWKAPSGGRKRPPYKAAASGRRQIRVSHLPGPSAGRCKHRPLRRGRPHRGCRTTAPASAPTQGAGCRSLLHCPCTLYCRAGVHARRGGLRRGDAVVLCKRRIARPGRLETPRKGIGKVMCRTPQSADADSSPCRGAFWVEAVCEASPARGGGCAERRRRRGALPAGGGDILQKSVGHCPMFRRGRCWHRPGTLRRRKGPSGGRKRPPYIAAGSGK